ncbi:MAG TPA: DoxX family protein, partial [Myxococcaceae bacterium]|nr:DoxX family protein [Myxococcaceae bacterium]
MEISEAWVWVGRVLSGLTILFLLMDAVGKLARPKPVVESTIKLGYPESTILGMGVTILVSTLLYAIPPTAPFGAILITGYLGGAVASQVRVRSPWGSHILFPIYVGAFAWVGLFLRDPRVQ